MRSRRSRPLAAAAALALWALASPTSARAGGVLILANSFPGASDDGDGVPPDVQGAAGPDHVLVMLNTTFVAQTKSGAIVKSWTPAQFWAPVSGGDLLFDPRVAFDALARRWVAVIATEGAGGRPPAVLLAVSDGDDPTLGWTFRKLPVGNGNYAEFPLLGYNGRFIVVTSNLISGSSGYLAGSAIWAVEKAPLLAQGTLAVTRFTLNSPGFPLAPVVTFDADEPDEFLVQALSANAPGPGKLRIFRLTGVSGQPVLAASRIVNAPAAWRDAPSPLDSLPQSGTARRITSDQDEVSSACLRHGTIWAVQTATIPASGSIPTHTVVQWWKLSPGAQLLGFGRIGDAAGDTWLGFPSVAVNAKDQVLIGYSIFSPGRFASAGFSLQAGCGSDGAALSAIHTLKEGDSAYERLDGGGHNRWGDLSQTAVDPEDDTTMWTLQEYAAPQVAGESRWGTWWGGLEPGVAAGRSGACVTPVENASPASVPVGRSRPEI